MSYYISAILSTVVLLLLPGVLVLSAIKNVKKEKKSGITEKKK